jgi:hypothetical protein
MIIYLKEDATIQNKQGDITALFGTGRMFTAIGWEYITKGTNVTLLNPFAVKFVDVFNVEQCSTDIKKQCFLIYEQRTHFAIPKAICEVPKIHNGYFNY